MDHNLKKKKLSHSSEIRNTESQMAGHQMLPILSNPLPIDYPNLTHLSYTWQHLAADCTDLAAFRLTVLKSRKIAASTTFKKKILQNNSSNSILSKYQLCL
jgi:hypothetical protein